MDPSGGGKGGFEHERVGPPSFPIGIPDRTAYDCQIECQQTWLEWYEDAYIEAYVNGLAGDEHSREAAESLRVTARVIELEIKLMGGTPGERAFDQDNPLSGTVWDSGPSDRASSENSAGSGTDPFAGTIFDTDGSSAGLLANTGLEPLAPVLESAVGAVKGWLDDWAPLKEN